MSHLIRDCNKNAAINNNSQVRFDFDPANPQKTTDSNVVEHSTISEILSSVTNGNYTIGTGTCSGESRSSPRSSYRCFGRERQADSSRWSWSSRRPG